MCVAFVLLVMVEVIVRMFSLVVIMVVMVAVLVMVVVVLLLVVVVVEMVMMVLVVMVLVVVKFAVGHCGGSDSGNCISDVGCGGGDGCDDGGSDGGISVDDHERVDGDDGGGIAVAVGDGYDGAGNCTNSCWASQRREYNNNDRSSGIMQDCVPILVPVNYLVSLNLCSLIVKWG